MLKLVVDNTKKELKTITKGEVAFWTTVTAASVISLLVGLGMIIIVLGGV